MWDMKRAVDGDIWVLGLSNRKYWERGWLEVDSRISIGSSAL